MVKIVMPKPVKYPTGVKQLNGTVKLACTFEPGMFEYISNGAKWHKRSFSEELHSVLSAGRMCLDESDQQEVRN